MVELYHAEQCPYCVKVRIFLERKSIAYVSKPVPLGRAMTPLKEELLQIAGKGQVPFIHDVANNVKMHESDDIIKYLEALESK
jgi:glutathione S-transferase